MKLFNSHFASQCNPVNNSSVPPLLEYKTNGPLVSVNIKDDIYPILGNSILKKLMNGTTDQLGGSKLQKSYYGTFTVLCLF